MKAASGPKGLQLRVRAATLARHPLNQESRLPREVISRGRCASLYCCEAPELTLNTANVLPSWGQTGSSELVHTATSPCRVAFVPRALLPAIAAVVLAMGLGACDSGGSDDTESAKPKTAKSNGDHDGGGRSCSWRPRQMALCALVARRIISPCSRRSQRIRRRLHRPSGAEGRQ